MKKVFAIAVAAVLSLLMVSTAQAGNETVTASTNIAPQKGSLYQAYPTSAKLTIRADVHVPDSEATVTPMKNTLIRFPDGLSFNPNSKVTPTCGDDKLNAQSPLGTPTAIVDACADSVVGTGTSAIYLAKFKANLLADPILVIFNAGVSNSGNPKIKIYGFSKGTGVGILMTGELKNGVLDVAIPVLSYDSAVQYYQFDIPGTGLVRPDIGVNTAGKDPNYVEAICPASGKLTTSAEFVLGQRDAATGANIGTEVTVKAPETTQTCKGSAGKAKLGGVKVKGPKSVRSGAKGTFKVTVKNTGTGVAKGVTVTATGGGKGKGGNIAPGASKTIKVKTKVSGRKGGKATIKFTAKAGNVKATGKTKVSVK